jgi:FkbH-like protein
LRVNEQDTSRFRFAFSATFTADPLRPAILFWGRQLASDFEVRFAPYDQLLQTLLDPNSEFGENAHGINILLARLEDFGRFQESGAGTLAKIESNVIQLAHELRAAAARMRAPLLLCLCPSSPVFGASEEFATKLCNRIAAELDDATGVHYIDYCDVQRMYPVAAVHNPEGERLGNIPYTDVYYCALATMLVRYAHALVRAPFKAIALDCDNTLWQGICGEDGPEGVVLDPSRRTLHECMLEQREAGMLLTMASKNNEADVLETFAVHPEMPLRLRHFAAWRLNWETKAENLVQLAQELNVGLDSFIFIDDNPKECAELQQAIPEVLTVALPEHMEETPQFLRHLWALDHPVITEEDRNRSVYYQQQQEFGAEIGKAASIADFMSTLELRVTVTALAPERMARAAQLTQRTNQFNLNGIRRTESDIQSMLASGHEGFTVDVSDRFGDYGVVGLMLVKAANDELQVDTFLLSCRVLGRGVEHCMLAALGQHAISRGLHYVTLPYVPTTKNLPAKQFLDSLGALRLPAAQAAEFTWKPPVPAAANFSPKPIGKLARLPRKADYGAIARYLSSAESILERVRSERTPFSHAEGMTETERKLARIWSELLERVTIVPTDNFFDIGGHSLLAVLLLLRIREAFGVELSIDDVYSGTLTLADLAVQIETAQLGNVDPEQYAALLAEIENMSDEQARQLLEKEQAGQA